jgi:hypothetical protein
MQLVLKSVQRVVLSWVPMRRHAVLLIVLQMTAT